MNKKLIILLGIMLSFAILLVGCSDVQVNDEKTDENKSNVQEELKEGEFTSSTSKEDDNDSKELIKPEKTTDKSDKKNNNENLKKPIATMIMENGDVVKIELYPNKAPETVKNFISLANSGFYDGLTFHIVIPSFMAQGGDPAGNGTGGTGYTITGEFKLNGVENNLSHDIGVVSMARTEEYDTAGSQFFIVTDDEYSKQSLDGQYAGFGKVIEGMEHVYTIVNSKVIRRDIDDELKLKIETEIATQKDVSDETYAEYYRQMMQVDRPINPPVIKSIRVNTFGVEYGEPTKY